MLWKSMQAAAVIATSVVFFCTGSNAQETLTIECDLKEYSPQESASNLRQYLCLMAVDGVASVFQETPIAKLGIEHLDEVRVNHSRISLSAMDAAEGDPQIIIATNQTNTVTLYSVVQVGRCNPETWSDTIGYYERWWCDTTVGGNKKAAANLYYLYSGDQPYLGTYEYHCAHESDRDEMPSVVEENVCGS